MSINNLYIYGAGGHSRVIVDTAIRVGVKHIVFVDDNPKVQELQGWPVVAAASITTKGWARTRYIVAIGLNRIRAEIFNHLMQIGATPVSLIDPSSVVSPYAIVGSGSFVAPGVIINTGAKIGNNCIINTASSIDHDCILGAHVQISPQACLTGNVRLGEGVMVGAGATIVPGCTIGTYSIIGAGSVVTRDLPEQVRAWGVPAKIIATSK